MRISSNPSSSNQKLVIASAASLISPLSLPGQSQPEAAVIVRGLQQRGAADELPRMSLQSQGPMPLIAPQHRWKGEVAIVGQCAVRRVRPWNGLCQETDDLPLRKEQLRLFCIRQPERGEATAAKFPAKPIAPSYRGLLFFHRLLTILLKNQMDTPKNCLGCQRNSVVMAAAVG